MHEIFNNYQADEALASDLCRDTAYQEDMAGWVDQSYLLCQQARRHPARSPEADPLLPEHCVSGSQKPGVSLSDAPLRSSSSILRIVPLLNQLLFVQESHCLNGGRYDCVHGRGLHQSDITP
ncbi:MAG: hypothetical protein R2712_09275 [Vicinamibacterales bacterium]